MIKILKYLFILQEVSNKDRKVKLGRGFSTAIRMNPYNPLSYVVVCFNIIVGILMFGFVGFWNEIIKNPFKWN